MEKSYIHGCPVTTSTLQHVQRDSSQENVASTLTLSIAQICKLIRGVYGLGALYQLRGVYDLSD